MSPEIIIMGYVFHQKKVLLVEHAKTKEFMSCGGHLEKNETFIECLKREIKEETNLEIGVIPTQEIKEPYEEPLPLNIISKNKENNKLIILEYLCKTNDISNFKLQKNELLSYTWLKEEEISENSLKDIVKQILRKAFKIMNSKI